MLALSLTVYAYAAIMWINEGKFVKLQCLLMVHNTYIYKYIGKELDIHKEVDYKSKSRVKI